MEIKFSTGPIKSFRKFYLTFNNLLIGQTMSDQSGNDLIIKGQAVSAELELAKMLLSNLSWSHYERLMRIKNEDERDWYMREAAGENWSVRTLDRNIGSQYYHSLLQTPESKHGEVIDEMHRLTADYQKDRHKFLQNPVVAEFLGFSQEAAYSETNFSGWASSKRAPRLSGRGALHVSTIYESHLPQYHYSERQTRDDFSSRSIFLSSFNSITSGTVNFPRQEV